MSANTPSASLRTAFVVPPLCPVDTSPHDYSASSSLIDRSKHHH